MDLDINRVFADTLPEIAVETTSGNAASGNTIEDNSENSNGFAADAPIYSQGSHNDSYKKRREELKNAGCTFHTITLPDTDTWGYDQTFARDELYPALMAERTNPDNWWLYKNGVREEQDKDTVRYAFEYDTELEKIAMQRAAELMFRYLHDRPNGIQYNEAYAGTNYEWAYRTNELITFGPMAGGVMATEPTADAITYGFMEEYAQGSAGQRHREVLISNKYCRIGVGVVKLADGTRFVAVEVSDDTTSSSRPADVPYNIPLSPTSSSPAVDGYQETQIELVMDKNGALTTIGGRAATGAKGSRIIMYPDGVMDIADTWFGPDANARSAALFKGNDPVLFNGAVWVSSNPSVAEVVDNRYVKVKSQGTANIKSTDCYGDVIGEFTIEVPAPTLTGATAVCAIDTAEVGTVINAWDVILVNEFDYGADEIINLSEYNGGLSFTVTKEGENTFTFNHPQAPNGVSMPVTFSVTGVKASANGGNGVNTGGSNASGSEGSGATKPAVSSNKLYTQKIVVAKKFQETYVVKHRSVRKSSKTYNLGTKIITSGGFGHGTVTYKVTKYPKNAKKYIEVNRKGKVTLKKGAKKGTYAIKITAQAVGNEYKKATKTVTIKVK